MIPAPRNNPDFNSHEWQDWFFQVWKAIGGSGGGSEMFSTTLINNQYSKANYTCGNTYYSTMGQLSSLSGSITSGVEKNVLSVTGKGAYHYLAIRKTSGLTCTATVRLNIDGVDVFNFTSAANSWNVGLDPYINLAGIAPTSATMPVIIVPIYFNSSLDLYLTSNATEANSYTIYYIRT